jgi:hypothetical protein
MVRNQAETRMQKLRGLSRTQEMGRRIVNAVNDTWEVVRADVRSDPPLVHRVERFDLPERAITDAEYAEAKEHHDRLAAKEKLTGSDHCTMRWHGGVVRRYQEQQHGPTVNAIEMHLLRLGELVIATNPFELYTDYGIQIQARSPAEQTILIQLASPVGPAGYLPTPRALAGKGYSATPQSCTVGPEAGQLLVERTVQGLAAVIGDQ